MNINQIKRTVSHNTPHPIRVIRVQGRIEGYHLLHLRKGKEWHLLCGKVDQSRAWWYKVCASLVFVVHYIDTVPVDISLCQSERWSFDDERAINNRSLRSVNQRSPLS